MRFRLDLAYDGTAFEGWQTQSRPHPEEDGRSVQSEIEKALSTIAKRPVAVVGAGRTDSGVHARGQTAHFDAETTMTGPQFVRGLNSLLPRDVRIWNCEPVDSNFHARFSALGRVYYYHLAEAAVLMPWDYNYVYRVTELPPLKLLNSIAGTLQGEMDFTTFAHIRDPNPNKTRYIYHASFFPQRDRVIFQIAGNAFLWRMVRSLVGTMLRVAAQGGGREEFVEILNIRDRKKVGPTAPAQGLYLQRVIYHEREFAF